MITRALRLARPLLPLLWAALAASTACDRLDTRRHLYRAADLAAQQKYWAAAAQYDTILQGDSGNVTATRQLALLRYRLGDVAAAYPLLLKAQQNEPTNSEVASAVGFAALARGDTLRAARTALGMLAGSETVEGYRLLGTTWLAERHPQRADSAFQAMIRLAPNDARGHYLRGLALTDEGLRDQAANEFETALKLSPGYVEPLARLAGMLTAEKRPNDAIARVKAQIALVPKGAGQQELLAQVYLSVRDTASAEAALRQAWALDPSRVGARIGLAELYRAAGRTHDADAALADAARASQQGPGALMLIAASYQRGGQVEEAQRLYQQVLAIVPGFAPAADSLARLRSDQHGRQAQKNASARRP